MEANPSYKFPLSFLEAKAKKEKLSTKFIPSEKHKQANNKTPRTQFKTLLSHIKVPGNLTQVCKIKRKSGGGGAAGRKQGSPWRIN